MGSEAAKDIKEYQSALRHFNQGLCVLGKTLGMKGNISSYTLRHSWATTAKYIGAPIEMISESLGHKSIKTTQIYLAGFNTSDLAKVNRKACKYVEVQDKTHKNKIRYLLSNSFITVANIALFLQCNNTFNIFNTLL